MVLSILFLQTFLSVWFVTWAWVTSPQLPAPSRLPSRVQAGREPSVLEEQGREPAAPHLKCGLAHWRMVLLCFSVFC